jgi:hypothetical protein
MSKGDGKESWAQWRIDNGYIGCCYREAEFRLFKEMLEAHGIPVERRGKYSTMGITISLYTTPEHVRRAREIRRGFKAATTIRGDVMDFLLGIRAALTLRVGRREKVARRTLPVAPNRRLSA